MILDKLKLVNQGKVRELYDLGENLLIVTSDRISVFDVILPDLIPDKGKVLSSVSVFWFKQLSSIIENHLISSDLTQMPKEVQAYAKDIDGRALLVKKATPLPVECIVRGYLTGSGLKDYQQTGTICGIKLPNGLTEASKLPEIIFTPSTKAEMGHHDENIHFEDMQNRIGTELAEKVRSKSIELFKAGMEIADKKGIIIADTKFEFGIYKDELILIDEVLTPDSSRFWPKETYEVGKPQDSFDKQFVRDYYLSIGWDKKSQAPRLPKEVIEKTLEKYKTLERLFIS